MRLKSCSILLNGSNLNSHRNDFEFKTETLWEDYFLPRL